jgi:hypothetical protein
VLSGVLDKSHLAVDVGYRQHPAPAPVAFSPQMTPPPRWVAVLILLAFGLVIAGFAVWLYVKLDQAEIQHESIRLDAFDGILYTLGGKSTVLLTWLALGFVCCVMGVFAGWSAAPRPAERTGAKRLSTGPSAPSPAPLGGQTGQEEAHAETAPTHNPARRWALAVPALLTQMNQHDHTILGGAARSPDAVRHRAAALQRSWNVHNRAELLTMLEWLAREGHRLEFNELCGLHVEGTPLASTSEESELSAKLRFIRAHRERIGARSLLAWDMVRLVTIAGWGHVTGMITEDEAWSYVLAAAQAVQRAHASWEDLGGQHLLGRAYWAGEADERYAICFRRMLDTPTSPWRILPWNTDLTHHGLRVPLRTIVLQPSRPRS